LENEKDMEISETFSNALRGKAKSSHMTHTDEDKDILKQIREGIGSTEPDQEEEE
jgi:hypothetical protein